MAERTVTLTIDAGLACVTLARPQALNALNANLKRELLQAFADIQVSDGVRAVLMVAQGKHFCVGQDLTEHVQALRKSRGTAMATVGRDYNPLLRAMAEIKVPVVVAVQGVCAGAGWGLAMAADIRVVAQKTSFRAAFAGIALAADSGLSHFLIRSLGPSRAAGILMLGDVVSAQQALDWGLVHRLADNDAAALDEARDLARQLASGPTLAYAQIKQLVASSDGLDAALEDERRAQEMLGASDDHLKAVDAFLAKDKPVFAGH